MSEENTEQPTAKRLRDAREKGEVPKSQEIPSAALVMIVAVYFIYMGPYIYTNLKILVSLGLIYPENSYEESLKLLVSAAVNVSLRILIPIVTLIIVTSLMSNLFQVGFLFNVKSILPKIENLNPAKWFKKTFSKQNLFELLKNILKVTILSIVVWRVIIKHFASLFAIPNGGTDNFLVVVGSTIKDLFLYAVGAFCFLAVVDYVYQRFKFTKNHMMSKDEVKREYKDMEGDPVIKSRRRQLHMEMANQSNLWRVRKAKVLITNHEHVAVALDYENQKDPLPRIMAAGEGELALRMIKEAKDYNIPIMKDVTLAQDLFKTGVVDSYIPKDLIDPVAKVLRWALSLKK